MKYGIDIQQYIKGEKICKYYGDKKCPCVSDKTIQKKYNTKNGLWAVGDPLPECTACQNFEKIDPSVKIPFSFSLPIVEMTIAYSQLQKEEKAKAQKAKEQREQKNTPVKVELLSANGGTAADRISKMLIGEALLGNCGALIGLLGSNASNVILIFKVTYQDGNSKIVTEKANSKKATRLLNMLETS